MLVIAQPRSASTSLIETLGRITCIKSCQIFNNNKKSYKSLYKPPNGYNFIQHHHSDFRDIPFSHVYDIIKSKSIIRKQHFPPTENIINGLKSIRENVVILLREPVESMESYRKLAIENYRESLNDLKTFHDEYMKLNGFTNILIINYDDLTTQFHTTITKILNHFDLPIPGNILKYKLSKKNTENNKYIDFLRDKKIVIVGPAPTLKGTNQGKKIDEYDIVVRMKQPIVPKELQEDYGKKTDVIYCNLNSVGYSGKISDHFNAWKENKLKWVIMSRRKKKRNRDVLDSKINEQFGYRRITKQFYRECKKKCSCKGRNIPFTGTIAILDLLRMPFKELYITGFNYYINSVNGENGHYAGFNTDKFESGVNYADFYKKIWSTGSHEYRHIAPNDIKSIKKATKARKNVIIGNDLKEALDYVK